MAESSCVYVVTYVPSGCTQFALDDIVTTACNEPCQDGIIGDGPCAGTQLTAVSSSCMMYPPEDGPMSQEAIDEALRRGRSGVGSTREIKSSEITGHYPAKR